MLRILDKNKVPVKGLRKYSDLCIENSIELDDKTLTFSVPYRNVRSAIAVEGYIETKDDRFVVKEIKKSSEGTATITAQLDLESLEGKPFRAFKSEEQTIKATLQLAFAGTGWTVGECSVSKKRTLSMANVSALDVLKQALKTYRAEIKIDSKKQSIDIYPEVGSDKGVYFSDQLNLRKLTVQYSTYDFYTEIEPYGKDGLTIETVNSGKTYLENHQYSSKKKRCIWKDERYTIADSLKEDAAAKLADMSYTRTYTLAEIGKLEASGGNLVKGYRLSADNVKTYWNTVGTVKTGQNDPDGGKNAVVITADVDNCILAAKRDTNAVLNATGRYTITFWAKASKAQTIAFSFNKVRESIALTTSWKKFSFVKDVTSVEESGSLIMFGGGNTISTGDGNIYIYWPDVRHGYTSEDIFNLLTNNGNIQGMYMTGGKLYWNGAYIKSKSITTAALAADSVTAEKIKVDDLYSLKASIAGFKISADTISHQSTTKPESGIGQTYYDTYFSSRDKRLTFRKGPGTSDYMTFSIKGLRTSSWKCLDLISDADVESGDFSSGNHHSLGYTNIYGILYVAAGLKVAGTKQAVRETENYGEKGVYCYETPTPYFGDIGSGEIAADGKCYVDIEDVLKEMINTEMQYYVFLQKRGEGDLYVSECSPDYFIVTGTPGLKFFWELKAKQKGYEYNRYEDEDKVVGFKQIAYDDEYIAETEKLIEEREEI